MGKPVDPCLHNWEGARAFLEVVKRGSFRSASQAQQVSVNTLRRHVEEFEREVGFTLFTRHVDGVRLTAEGKRLVGAVKRMETASFDLIRAKDVGASLHGQIRLSVPDSLGLFWLTPRLVDFQRDHPGLLIDLHCSMEPMGVMRLESDLAIHVKRPKDKDTRIVKLGRIHLMPHASQAYLDAHGTPRTLSEMLKHRIVLYTVDKFTLAEEFAQLFLGQPQDDAVSFNSNLGSSNFMIIAHGGGIGLLPTYAPAIGGMVVPVDVKDIRYTRDLWLMYHPDAVKITRIRIMIDWLIENFSPKKYPWFADEFIHPREMTTATREFFMPSGLRSFLAGQSSLVQN